jgi:hypothetical protein
MDRARQDWVHEYAETGKPPYPTTETCHPHDKEQNALLAESGNRGPQRGWWPTGRMETRRRFRQRMPDSDCADRPCIRWWWNGPAGNSGMVSARMAGHTLSAIGSLQHTTHSACTFGKSPWFATLRPKADWLASDRSSESISPSGPARLHPSLPRVPTALSCRTER